MDGAFSRGAVEAEILAILARLKDVAPESVSLEDDDDFLRELDMDSIDAVELTIQLDARFDVHFGAETDDIDRLASFGTVVDLVLMRGRSNARF